jgi:hypothetical protein
MTTELIFSDIIKKQVCSEMELSAFPRMTCLYNMEKVKN